MRHPLVRAVLLGSAAAIAATLASPSVTAATRTSDAPEARAPDMTAVPLIPRALLFGEPERTAVRISPDGKSLSWLAPDHGVLNLWIAPVANPAAARAITAETEHPLQRYIWTPDSRSILIQKDDLGDENWQLFVVPAAGGPERRLLGIADAKVLIQAVSPRIADRIAVSINDRDPKWPDVYSLDLRSGERTLLLRNDGHFDKFVFDDDLRLRIATRPAADGGYELYKVSDGKVAGEPYDQVAFDDMQTTRPLGFSGDGRTLFWTDSRGRDTAALTAEDVASGKRKILASDPRADLNELVTDPRSGKPLAYGVNYLTNEYHPLDHAAAGDLRKIKRQLGDRFAITSQSFDDSKWMLVVDRGDAPYEYWLFDRTPGSLKRLFVSRPELSGKTLAQMLPLEIRSRDGLKLVSYLTLPPGSDADADGVPDHPVPMVLLVHGGPWNRSDFGFASTGQMLANRGYAVLEPNFRASTGFGKAFIRAGDGEWAGKMQDDLIDAVDWAIARGITAPGKVAIMGSSYGGYATLIALSKTPDRFACGVDSAGPSNLQSLLAGMPAHWESMRKQLYRRMADPNTDAGLAWLKDRSPITHVGGIAKPLLIGQGAKDPRVNTAEAEQVVDALTKRSVPVTYVLYADEGHGLRHAANRMFWSAITEQFLAQCLGGRAEPIGNATDGSKLAVKTGGELIAGLKQGQ